jgi:hypothetical protein
MGLVEGIRIKPKDPYLHVATIIENYFCPGKFRNIKQGRNDYILFFHTWV